jgi:hypothetical protein
MAEDIKNFLTDRSGNYSLMNLRIKEYLTENDYYEITITDKYQYRFDLIARDYMGMNSWDYWYFIFWINDIYDLDELTSGTVIKIPSYNFIRKIRNQIKEERGI